MADQKQNTLDNLTNNRVDLDVVIQRLRNGFNSAEGPTLPPRQFGDTRIPRVSGLKVARAQWARGGTNFTIVWEDVQATVTCYLVTPALETTAGTTTYPSTAVLRSPANVLVPVAGGQTVTFRVQAVSATGLATPLQDAAVCSAKSPYPTWTAATLSSGWANFGFGWADAGYMVDYNGVVHFRGLITGGTMVNGDDILTVPPHLAPKPGHLMFPVCGNTTNAQYLQLLTTGILEIGQVSSNGFLSLSSISYQIEA